MEPALSTKKWRNMASWAKIIPANGALKPADIAAATPPPRIISVLIRSLRIALIHEPKVAPKCTNGPYCPTDAPPAAERNAARVLATPVLISSSLSTL